MFTDDVDLKHVAADDCGERPYAAGTAFVDPGHGHVHTAFNRTNEETVIVATFFEAPEQGPLLIPAAADETRASEDAISRAPLSA